MSKKEFVCIVCPNSCKLSVEEKDGELMVTGAACKRGIIHGRQEYQNPRRMLTTTVVVQDGIYPRISVVSRDEIPKEKLKECLSYLYKIRVSTPIHCGDILVKNICGTGVDILASRSMKTKSEGKMKREELILQLQAIVGEAQVVTGEEVILEASRDYIGYRRYQRDDGKNMVPRAACVVQVKNTGEASRVLKFLNANRVDVVPRTGGSSVTRGIEPQEGGVILDGSCMNEILEINEEDLYVTAKCGTPLEYLEECLNKKGYTTGHFPQSFPLARVGGLLATRSIGQFSTLYGGIEDLVVGLEAVLADGEVIRIKNVPRRSVGPDLRHLFIGNEGMLGFITEATLKIFKYQPDTRFMKAYGVKGMQNGLNLIREVMREGYRPAVVRLHDPVEVQEVLKIDAPENMALLMFLCEGPERITKATGEGIEEIAARYDVQDLGTKPVESWLITRNDVCNDLNKPVFYDMGAVIDTCEISANWSAIGKIYEAVTKRLREEIKTLVLCGGHSSHSYMQGTNIYFEFGFQVTEGANQAEEEYMHVVRIILEETLKYGGSIAHHHGSGKYRTPWMPAEHGSSYPLLYKLKEAFDPNGILNKGVILVEKEVK